MSRVVVFQAVAETQFLVSPLTMYGGKEITDAEAQQIHKGPMSSLKGENKPDPVSHTERSGLSMSLCSPCHCHVVVITVVSPSSSWIALDPLPYPYKTKTQLTNGLLQTGATSSLISAPVCATWPRSQHLRLQKIFFEGTVVHFQLALMSSGRA